MWRPGVRRRRMTTRFTSTYDIPCRARCRTSNGRRERYAKGAGFDPRPFSVNRFSLIQIKIASGKLRRRDFFSNPLSRATGLLLFLGWGLFRSLLRSLLSCVLHRAILPNVKFAIQYRSQCDSYIRLFAREVKKKMNAPLLGPWLARSKSTKTCH